MNDCQGHLAYSGGPGRRRFLQKLVLGGGATLLATSPWGSAAQAGGHVDALLLSCMDYRLIDDMERYMAGRGMQDCYDHFILAGASLGALTDQFPAWGKAFWEHVDIAIKLHSIHTVIVMDHRDCGAYKVILGPAHAESAERERDAHRTHLLRLKGLIHEKHPALKVETLLMGLEGQVEVIA